MGHLEEPRINEEKLNCPRKRKIVKIFETCIKEHAKIEYTDYTHNGLEDISSFWIHTSDKQKIQTKETITNLKYTFRSA